MRIDLQPRDSLAARGLPEPEPDLAGMPRAVAAALRQALAETTGLILVAGPPGSGKASTLATLLASRPDAVEVGEIDHLDSAGRALDAARRSLVLATISAGSAIAAIRRLTGLGIDPFPLARALHLVLAQRLVRRLCQSCRAPVQPPNAVTAPLGLDPGSVVYEARGCGLCEGSGFAGRVAVLEAVPVDANVGRLIVCGGEGAAIANHVFRTWPNLAASARALVVQGGTTAGEAVRLLRDAQRQ